LRRRGASIAKRGGRRKRPLLPDGRAVNRRLSDWRPCEDVARSHVDERMDVAHLSRSEVAGLIRAGDVDVKTIAGLALAGWNPIDG
jgi:hypothetical protein